MMDTDLQRNLSKAMTYHLRHNEEVKASASGWVKIPRLLEELNQKYSEEITINHISQIVDESDKQRFELDREHGVVRSLYGHSKPDISINENECTVEDTPEQLFHGTPVSNEESIESIGLQPQSRNTVHLTSDISMAIETALRHREEGEDLVVYAIDTQEFLEAHTLRNPSGETFTASEVPPEYLRVEKRITGWT